jgi:4-carboxymuconolactone decarboxylase
MTVHVPHPHHAPRILPLDPPFEGELGALLARLTPPGAPNILALFRTLAKNPKLAECMMATGGHFLGKGSSLAMRDREILIARTCARCGAEYEWGVHVAAFAKAAGFSDAEIRATMTYPPDADAWASNEAALIAVVDALHETSTVDDTTWAELARYYVEGQLVEIVMLVGWYHAISFVCNALRVPLENWQARMPKAL